MCKRHPSTFVSVLLLATVALVLFIGTKFGVNTSSLLFVNIAILLFAAVIYGVNTAELQELINDGLMRVAPAILIVLIVGAMISMWIQCGLVPLIVYYGIKWLNANTLLIATFLLCCLLSICTGSSWGTCGTVGIACAAIGASMGIPFYIMAGVAISGATLGDKISPFSDTTVVAASIAGCSVYEHIGVMFPTTFPSFILTCIAYIWLGTKFTAVGADFSASYEMDRILLENFVFSPWLLLIPVVVLALSIKKVDPLIALTLSTVLGALFSIFLQGNSLPVVLNALYFGNTASTGSQLADTVLNRGGITSMSTVIIIIVLCVMMSSIVRSLHLLDAPMKYIKEHVKSDKGLILATLFSGLLMVLFFSSLYVSGIMLGEFFRDIYDERKLKFGVLSRSIEEATTITTPLIPWHSSFHYYSSLFGLTDLRFIPYAVFCWMNFFVSIVMTVFGFGMKKLYRNEPEEQDNSNSNNIIVKGH